MSFPDPKPYENLKAFINVLIFFITLILGFKFSSIPENTIQAANIKEYTMNFEPLYVVIMEEITEYHSHRLEYFIESDFYKEAYITSQSDLINFLSDYELIRFEQEVILSTSVKQKGHLKKYSQFQVSFSRDLSSQEKELIQSELLY